MEWKGYLEAHPVELVQEPSDIQLLFWEAVARENFPPPKFIADMVGKTPKEFVDTIFDEPQVAA